MVLRSDSLIVLGEYLAAHHREVRRLEQLERAHVEGFLAWNHGRPWRGRVARDKPVSLSASKRAVVDLRAFFKDLAVWGWAERPARPLLFASDVPRLDRPLPRALAPDADRDLMAAVTGLGDAFARFGLIILRGTGMRLGELLDLELDCLWDTPTHGTWVKVPVGKLGTEGTVPLDAATLAAFDAWMPTGAGNARSPIRATAIRPNSCSWNGAVVSAPTGSGAASMTPSSPAGCGAAAARRCGSPRTSSGTPTPPTSSTPACPSRRSWPSWGTCQPR